MEDHHRAARLLPTLSKGFTAITIAAISSMGCDHAARSDVYRESEGRVAECQVNAADSYLRVAVFIKRKGGEIQYPYVYYPQGHFTMTGYRQVEKPGRMYTIVTPRKGLLHLPTAEDIDEYLLLVSKPLPDEAGASKQRNQPTSWSDGQLFRVDATGVRETHTIALPSFNEIEKSSAASDELCRKLRVMYEKAATEAAKRSAAPVKQGDKVPEYAR